MKMKLFGIMSLLVAISASASPAGRGFSVQGEYKVEQGGHCYKGYYTLAIQDAQAKANRNCHPQKAAVVSQWYSQCWGSYYAGPRIARVWAEFVCLR